MAFLSNLFANFNAVLDARKAGTINTDQAYAALETIGLHKATQGSVAKDLIKKATPAIIAAAGIASGVGAAGAVGGLGGLLGKGSSTTGGMLKNFLPAVKDINFGDLLNKGFELAKGAFNGGINPDAETTSGATHPTAGFEIRSIPVWVWVVVGVVLFWKQIKKLFR